MLRVLQWWIHTIRSFFVKKKQCLECCSWSTSCIFHHPYEDFTTGGKPANGLGTRPKLNQTRMMMYDNPDHPSPPIAFLKPNPTQPTTILNQTKPRLRFEPVLDHQFACFLPALSVDSVACLQPGPDHCKLGQTNFSCSPNLIHFISWANQFLMDHSQPEQSPNHKNRSHRTVGRFDWRTYVVV